MIKSYCTLLIALCTTIMPVIQSHAEIMGVYREFKNTDITGLKQLMVDRGFSVEIYSKTDINLGRIDSLYMTNTTDNSWVLFKSVDLGYLKDLEMVYAIETQNVHKEINHIISEVTSKYPESQVITDEVSGSVTIQYVTEDLWIVDDRWKQASYTPINTLFTYRITDYGNALLVELTETIPQKMIESPTIPEAQLNPIAISQR